MSTTTTTTTTTRDRGDGYGPMEWAQLSMESLEWRLCSDLLYTHKLVFDLTDLKIYHLFLPSFLLADFL